MTSILFNVMGACIILAISMQFTLMVVLLTRYSFVSRKLETQDLLKGRNRPTRTRLSTAELDTKSY